MTDEINLLDELDIGDEDTDFGRGYARGVAEGRRQAAEAELPESFGYWRAVEKLRGEEVLEVLVAHVRLGVGGCSCGWAEWGKRHSRHVADAVAEWLEARGHDIYWRRAARIAEGNTDANTP